MVKRKQIQNFSTFIENSKVYEVLNTLEKEGFEAYLAGGAVRDMLLGKSPHDFDVATNARPKDIKRLFPKHLTRGERFGTITVIEGTETFEVTTYRSEDVYTDSRHPDLIKFSDSLFEDSKRRDFTINGLYADKEGRLQDPQDGLKDLESKLIRTIGDPEERFSEDALRVLRALRFSSQLGFEIQDNTLKSALEHWTSLSKVSSERVFEELRKMIIGENFLKVLPMILEHKLLDQFVDAESYVEKNNTALTNLNSKMGLLESKNISPTNNLSSVGSLFLSQRLATYKGSSCKLENFLLDFALVNYKNYEVYLKNWFNLFPFRKNEKNRIEDAVYLLKILGSKDIPFSAGKIIAKGLKIWPVNELKLFLTKDLLNFLNLDFVQQDLILKILITLNDNPNPKIKGQDLMSHGIKAGPGLRQKLDLAFELQLENPDLSVDQLIEKIIL